MTESTSDDLTVSRNDEAERYEIRVGGELAGFTEYRPTADGGLIFPHTEIDPAFGGRGLGSVLVGEAMADVAHAGKTVIPVCPFVAKYLREHEVAGLTVQWRDEA